MQQITIFTGEESDESLNEYASRYNKDAQDRITFQFKEFVNKYLKKELPDFETKTVIIDKIPNWELIKIYRIILQLNHKDFTLFVHYKAEEIVNKYA